LPKHQAVGRKGAPELRKPFHLSAEWEEWDVPLDPGGAVIDPKRFNVSEFAMPGIPDGFGKHRGPRVSYPARERRGTVPFSNVLADRVALVAVNTAFTLLQIDRIGRKVPVDDGVAILMEVEAFLADRCRRQNERPERRVEGRPNGSRPLQHALFVGRVATKS
jgi:hypothetical protein